MTASCLSNYISWEVDQVAEMAYVGERSLLTYCITGAEIYSESTLFIADYNMKW